MSHRLQQRVYSFYAWSQTISSLVGQNETVTGIDKADHAQQTSLVVLLHM